MPARIPENAILIGHIDQHPDSGGLWQSVLFYPATGIEVAWDGYSTRPLPRNWRSKSAFTPVNPANTLARKGGSAKSEAKAAAAKINGAKGGRPRKKPQ